MTFKKLFIAAGIFAAGTFSAAASDIIVDNLGGGNYSYIGHGSSDDHLGGRNYDVYSMEVTRSDAGIMTVRINTRFVAYNDQDYVFGDLFMSTTGWNPTGNASNGYQADNAFNTGTQWDYVYDLNGARDQTGDDFDTSSASLHALNGTNDFEYGTYRGNDEHLYRVGENAKDGKIAGGSVETNVDYNNKSNSYLEFVFNVSNTDLASAQQIAFHWTMSCANDIIEGVIHFAGNKVPEPAALGLLLLGLTAVGFARRRKQKS
ncbi:MAG: PEP-CTERM sorting domain-containing protein [Emcibacter sp.]|nr:PEP-CTERM sorting domain-containing protein [Emcibacter sp.]